MAKAFEDLYIWQISRQLVNLIYDLTDNKTFRDFSLKDQIQRAAVSIISNIAEGFERGTKDEFLYFLYIAKGSCGEVRAQLYIALDRKFISQSQFFTASEKTRQVSATLYKFIEGFKAKGFTGIRHKQSAVPTEQDKFDQYLKQLVNADKA